MTDAYPRDLIGYGRTPPNPQWPTGARIAVEFCLAYETGGESHILHGDQRSEDMLTDVHGLPAVEGGRGMLAESTFEFGSRVGLNWTQKHEP
ncbi:MAG: hypothetical protein GY791_12825 [Alphaproteobacteria bacterium]|nr:hypothetical protein [Alphaproteobacteria bacterium]